MLRTDDQRPTDRPPLLEGYLEELQMVLPHLIHFRFGSSMGFSGSANLTVSFILRATDPCCHGNEIWDETGYNSACTALICCCCCGRYRWACQSAWVYYWWPVTSYWARSSSIIHTGRVPVQILRELGASRRSLLLLYHPLHHRLRRLRTGYQPRSSLYVGLFRFCQYYVFHLCDLISWIWFCVFQSCVFHQCIFRSCVFQFCVFHPLDLVLCFPVCIFHWFDLVFRLPVLRFPRLHFYGPASPYTHTGAGYQPTRRLVEVVAVAEEHPVRSVPAVWSGADRDVFQPDAGRSEEQVSTTRSTSRTYQVDQTTTLRCIFKGAFRAT